MEYVMIVGVLLLLLAPLVYYGVNQTRESVRYNEAQATLNTLTNTIESLNKLGPGNSKMVDIYIPPGVEEFSTNDTELYFVLESGRGSSYIESYTESDLTSDDLPTTEGDHKLLLTTEENNTVHICTPSCEGFECGTNCEMDCGSCGENQLCSSSFCICDTGYEDCDGNSTCECDITGDNECVEGECLDVNPDYFEFTDLTNQEVNATISSEIITLSNFDKSTITVSGDGSPEISCNNETWADSCEVNEGETIQVRLTTGSEFVTNYSVSINIGDEDITWKVMTKILCETGYIDCDGDVSNGCETVGETTSEFSAYRWYTEAGKCRGDTIWAGSNLGWDADTCLSYCISKGATCIGRHESGPSDCYCHEGIITSPYEWSYVYTYQTTDTVGGCYQWATGDWSTCSTASSCGTGTQTRDVYCEHIFDGEVDDSYCTGTKPSETQSCTVRPCSYTCCNTGLCCAAGYTYTSCGGNTCGKDKSGCNCVWAG